MHVAKNLPSFFSLRRLTGSSLLAGSALIMAIVPACGKKEAPAAPPASRPAQPAAAEAPAAGLPIAASPAVAEPPPPELGVPVAGYIAARILEKCALAHYEDPVKAETHAVNQLLGKPFPVNMEHVFDAPPKVPAAAKPAAKAKTVAADSDTPEQFAMRQKYRLAHPLAQAHTATVAQIQAGLTDCLYAAEVGLITSEMSDRYIKAFVEIACLQHKFTGPDGQIDATSHAQAAAAVFATAGMSAAEFARLGMIFGRFPKLQAKLHAAKAAACPDPRAVEQEKATSGEWNGQLSGERGGALHLSGTSGHIKGAVQWTGATVRYADGGSESQALPIEGNLGGDKISLFGEVGSDWVRLEGKVSGDKIEGTWTSQRSGVDKFKGTWTAEKIPAQAPAAPAK